MRSSCRTLVSLLAAAVVASALAGCSLAQQNSLPPQTMQKRWLFVWRDMSDPKEVDRMIARFPQAQAGQKPLLAPQT